MKNHSSYKIADVRFNGGAGALLCNKCKVILSEGFFYSYNKMPLPEDKLHYCKKCSKE